MGFRLLFSLVAVFFSLPAWAQLNTGPYVLYHGDSVSVVSINHSEVHKRVLHNKALENVEVKFDDHPDWNFSVPLMQSITIPPSVSKRADKMLFVSDIEGEFEALRSLWIAAEVIDKQYNWIFGDGKLVYCGDLFDRGKKVPELLWLLYLLEQKAVDKGGKVHIVLGNHDIMNLSGNFKYVDSSFHIAAEAMGYAYEDLFSKSTELGRWLRSKNLVEKLDDLLIVHASISPQVNALKLSVQEINELSRGYYDRSQETKGLQDTLEVLFNSKTSPFWYRGYFKEPFVSEEELNQTLQFYGVNSIVVGHTIVPENISFRLGNRVLGVNVNHHKGQHEAALYEHGKWYKINDKKIKNLLCE